MPSFFTVDRGLPCRNPSCKSYGRPHPNCNCYAFKAEGGEAESVCSSMQPHNRECEYYADGGDVLPSFDALDDDSSNPNPQPTSDPSTQSFDDLVDDNTVPASTGLKFDDLKDDQEKYGTPAQQIGAGIEGLAQGVLSKPLAVWAETHLLGQNPEDIAGRESVNPITHAAAEATGLVGGFLTGTGEAGLIAKGVGKIIPEAIGAAGTLGKIGSAAVKGFIENAAIQGTDEIGNAMLGKGDPETPWASAAAHMGAAGILGGIGGAAFGTGRAALKAIGESQLGTRITDFLSGIGAASRGEEMPGGAMFNAGMKFYNKGIGQIVKGAARTITDVLGGIAGAKSNVPGGGAIGTVLADHVAPYIEKLIGRPITGVAQKYIPEAVMKILTAGDITGVWDAINYAHHVGSGAQLINKGISSVFKAGGQQAVEFQASENAREKLKHYIQEGGLNQQIQSQQQQDQVQPFPFAHGGEVPEKPLPPQQPVLQNTDPISKHWPDQGMLMSAAKGRIVNYLNSVRPLPPVGQLPYDEHHEDPHQKRVYDRAIDIALQPMSILNHIKSGTLDPETLQHFTSMYPELHSHLSKKLTEKIMQTKMDEEKPNYKVRQSMSYFLGAPLDSTFTPASIQAAQSVFINKRQQQIQAQPPIKVKKGTAPLSKASSQYETQSQASIARQRNS